MKKIFLILMIVSAANTAFAQVGINNDDPKATLHVKGQKDSLAFRIDKANGTEILRIDESGKVGIGDVAAPKSNLHVKAGAVRIEGLTDQASNTEVYKNVLVTKADGNLGSLPLSLFETELPNIKTIKYITHTAELTGTADQIRNKTTIALGDIKVRFSPVRDNTPYWGYIQVQMSKPNHYACYWEKIGDGTSLTDHMDYNSKDHGEGYYRIDGEVARYFQASNDGTSWDDFRNLGANTEAERIKDDYNPDYKDIVTAILVLNNSKHIYRLNFVASGAIPAKNGVPAVNGIITIFIEQLTGI